MTTPNRRHGRLDLALLARTTCTLAFVRVGLWFLSYDRLERTLSRVAKPARSRLGREAPTPERIGIAVGRASRLVPRCSTCLPRALAARRLLCRYGHPAELRFGAARDEADRFWAHAWVESDGVVIVGSEELGRFRPFHSRSADASG